MSKKGRKALKIEMMIHHCCCWSCVRFAAVVAGPAGAADVAVVVVGAVAVET